MYMSKYSNNCIHMYFIQSINEFWKGYKIIKKSDNIFECSIDKIEFGCSYVAIYKKLRNHWINV